MINRRHIRIKVMQNVYAFIQSKNNDIKKQENYLYLGINKLYELYIIQLNLLISIQKFTKKRLEISKTNRVSKNKNEQGFINIINNKLLEKFSDNFDFNEFIQNKNLNIWKDKSEYVQLIWEEILESEYFAVYNKNVNPTFKDDKNFILDVFKRIIAPNEKLIDFYESENIGWVDDLPFVNTQIVKDINRLKEHSTFVLDNIYKDEDDREFVKKLFTKTALHFTDYDADIDELTPNWEFDRIAQIDLILIKLGIAEFLFFPSIPTKVTINEYIELSKDYSSDKSSTFINGILDKISKKYSKEEKIKKIGRGLL